MKKVKLSGLQLGKVYRLTAEEKKQVTGGYEEVAYPEEPVVETPYCPLGTMPVWYGCSQGGATICMDCSNPLLAGYNNHPNCLTAQVK